MQFGMRIHPFTKWAGAKQWSMSPINFKVQDLYFYPKLIEKGAKMDWVDDAIIKIDGKENDVDKVADRKVIILKLSWYMPYVTLNDEAKLSLMKDIKNKTSIDIGFLNRQCERYNIKKGMRELDWQLNITARSEKPRYILVGIQETSDKQQTSNGAIFSYFYYRNAFVQLNKERYPEHDLRVNYDMNNFIQPCKMVVGFFEEVLGKEQLPFGLNAFESLFSILLFDTSNQSEKLRFFITRNTFNFTHWFIIFRQCIYNITCLCFLFTFYTITIHFYKRPTFYETTQLRMWCYKSRHAKGDWNTLDMLE